MITFRTSTTVATATATMLALSFVSLAEANDRPGEGGRAGVAPAASYSVTFVPTWNPSTHPLEYPFAHAKKGFLTPMVGATHGVDYRIFAQDKTPTPGLERISETGKGDKLEAEIRAAIAAGRASSVVKIGGGSPGPVHPAMTGSFTANKANAIFSAVGMIAPSPDWFYGVNSVRLLRNGRWIPSQIVPVYAWDSGGDSGRTYLAADSDLEKKSPTKRLCTPHFIRAGEAVPVGVVVLKRLPQAQQ